MGDLLRDYVTLGTTTTAEGRLRESSFSAAVRDARAVSGRDPGDGRVVDEPSTSRWTGAVAWLCLFDQIGTALKVTGQPSPSAPNRRFKACLTAFSALVDYERNMLWSLRCCLAHDYGLWDAEHSRVEFALVSDSNKRLLWEDTANRRRTVVNLRALGDLGNQVVEGVQASTTAGTIELARPDAEIERRYFLVASEVSGPFAFSAVYMTSTGMSASAVPPSEVTPLEP